MPADTVGCAIRADDHGHGVPADQTLDATLDFLAAREGRLIFGADAVDVGRHGGERQARACHPRMVAEPLEQPLDAAAVTRLNDVVERLEPLALLQSLELGGVAGCDVPHLI